MPAVPRAYLASHTAAPRLVANALPPIPGNGATRFARQSERVASLRRGCTVSQGEPSANITRIWKECLRAARGPNPPRPPRRTAIHIDTAIPSGLRTSALAEGVANACESLRQVTHLASSARTSHSDRQCGDLVAAMRTFDTTMGDEHAGLPKGCAAGVHTAALSMDNSDEVGQPAPRLGHW